MAGETSKIEQEQATVFEIIESWICGLIGMMVAFEVAVGMLLVLVDFRKANFHISHWVSVPVALVLVPGTLWTMMAIWESLNKRRYPVGLEMGKIILQWPTILRRFSTLSWAANGILTLGTSYAFSVGLQRMDGLEWGPTLGITLFALSTGFLGNVYIVLFVTALTSRLDWAKIFWSWRLIADLTITVMPLFLVHR